MKPRAELLAKPPQASPLLLHCTKELEPGLVKLQCLTALRSSANHWTQDHCAAPLPSRSPSNTPSLLFWLTQAAHAQ